MGLSVAQVSNIASKQPGLEAYMSEDNYLRRCVEWIRKDRPWYEQAAVYSAVALGALVLTVSIFGIAVLVQAFYENKELALRDQVIAADEQIMGQFGGAAKFSQIPSRALPNLDWDNFADFTASSMQESLERATDQFNRPGVLMRIRDKKTQRTFVQAIFRKYVYNPEWDYSRGAFSIFSGATLNEHDLATLGKVLQDRHRRYTLY